jgi:uncharacterized protein (TIGR03437 family)
MRALLLLLAAAALASAQNPRVRFATNLGNIDVELLQDVAPRTVQNFLNYVNRGDYNGSFFHRSVRNFVIQGGGFRWSNGPVDVRADPAIRNEFRTPNTRGTIAMARTNVVDSATNQWFFNLGDNREALDRQNGGFTVFGRVIDTAGLSVMDRIAAVPIFNAGGTFAEIPLQNYTSGAVSERNLIIVNTITRLDQNQPAISDSGIITAGGFGGMRSAAPGSFIEIYGRNLAGATRTWGASDFSGDNAPTSLDGVSVLVGGVPAFVYFISPGQVNVQLPASLSPGPAGVVVTNRGQSTAVTDIEIRATSPGLLAPANFRAASGAQFVAALRPDGSFVANGTVAGLPDRPALPDETIIFYGTGFGAVTPSSVAAAGQTVREANTVVAPVEFRFGDKPGRITYSGLAPGLVGLYQFNVVVPSDAPTGTIELNVTVAGRRLEQTLYLPLRP